MNKHKKKAVVGVIALVTVLFFVFFPLILIGGMLSALVAFLNPSSVGMQAEDVHWKAVQAVSAAYAPENTMDEYLIKTIDLLSHDQITQNQREIEQFIIQWFLLKLEREVTETVMVDGVESTTTRTEIYYRYKTFYEAVSTIREPPFSFEDGKIAMLINLSMVGIPPGDGAPGDEGGPVTPGSPGGGTLGGRYPAPVQNGVITQGYEWRVNPISGEREFHPALDIQGAWHSPITSLADGVVIRVNRDASPYGNYVTVRHELPEGRFYSMYGHLSQITVQEGQTVSQLGQLGIEGGDPDNDPNPGWSTGHHVHLEIWTDRGRLNPADYIY